VQNCLDSILSGWR